MTRFRPPLALLFSSIFVCSAALVVRAAAPDNPLRITAAANVTLRTTPSATAETVAQLPLGTELAPVGPAGLDKTWIRVKLGDAREGWVQASLTRPLDPAWRWPTFDRIIADRLGRKGDGFQASTELVAFIDRVTPEYTDPDGRARLEYSRLRAMSAALTAIPAGGSRREPYASWLASKKADVILDEPGGRWMMSDSSIWERQARLSSTAVADDIGWFVVTNGLAGECEGRLVCYLNARNRLYGEYLRRFPAGAHAAEAVDVVKSTADLLAAPPTTSRAAYVLDVKKDCREYTSTLDALSDAVKGTKVAGKDAALTSLAALRRGCQ
jgi:hypothetical protein